MQEAWDNQAGLQSTLIGSWCVSTNLPIHSGELSHLLPGRVGKQADSWTGHNFLVGGAGPHPYNGPSRLDPPPSRHQALRVSEPLSSCEPCPYSQTLC